MWTPRFCKAAGHNYTHSFPSHNNSSRDSNLLSTLYMWLSSLYGLITLHYLAQFPYLSHNQHSVSVFSPPFVCPTPTFVPHYRLFHIQCCWINYTYRYILTRTLISRTAPVSLYTTVTEPIQQHTAVHYYSWLRWTAMNLFLQQTVTRFCYSDFRLPFTSQVQFVCCGCFLCAFSWVCWRYLRKRRICYLSSRGRLILSY